MPLPRLPPSVAVLLLATLLAITLGSGGCSAASTPGPARPTGPRALVPPAQAALDGARALQATAPPGTEVRFSQLHGYPVHIQTLPPSVEAGLTSAAIPVPAPLELSHGPLAAGRASALIKFISRHHALFGLPTPDAGVLSELKVSLDLTNPERNEDDKEPNPTGVYATRVDQHIGGLPVVGRYVIGQFDAQGNLYSAVMRLLPIDRTALDLKPAYSGAGVATWADPAMARLATGDQPELGWLSGVRLADPGVTSSAMLVLLPEAEAPGAKLRLAYQLRVRRAIDEAVLYLDARTGGLIRAYDNLPTAWHDEPATLISATAPDEKGIIQPVLACRRDGRLYMGFGSNYLSGATRPFNPNNWLSMMDGGDPFVGLTPYSQANPSPTASAFDPAAGYTGAKPQLTQATRNIQATLDWWAARGWRSWDGRGSHLGFLVNARPRASGLPSYNAWGAGGYILTGGAATNPAALTLAADREVIGHEFMHNVIEASSGLEYNYESGALSESLADLFGVALTVNAATDRLADGVLGEISNMRSMQDPPAMGQPDRYSEFVETGTDFGGVHKNSGILNKAHWLMVQGGWFNGLQVEAIGAAKVLDLIRTSNLHGRLGPHIGLEEFAAVVLARCRLGAVKEALLTGQVATLNHDCAMVERAYRAVELLPRASRSDLLVESASSLGGWVEVRVRNASAEGLELTDYDWELMDGATVVNTRPVVVPSGPPDYRFAVLRVDQPELNLQPGTLSWLVPGGSASIRTFASTGIGLTVLTTPRTMSVRLSRTRGTPELYTLNNRAEVTFSSELSGLSGMPLPALGGLEASLVVTVMSQAMGQAAPITTVLLTRNTASGPFSVIPGSEQTPATDLYSYVTRGELSQAAVTLAFSANAPWTIPAQIVLPDAAVVSLAPFGRDRSEVWFDATGGRPELAGRRQVYLLVDALDLVTELDEGDNLLCLNCGPAPSVVSTAVSVVRFPRETTNLEALFPAPYRAAAAKLLTNRAGSLAVPVGTVEHTGLSFRR
jgi:hypothetical protein